MSPISGFSSARISSSSAVSLRRVARRASSSADHRLVQKVRFGQPLCLRLAQATHRFAQVDDVLAHPLDLQALRIELPRQAFDLGLERRDLLGIAILQAAKAFLQLGVRVPLGLKLVRQAGGVGRSGVGQRDAHGMSVDRLPDPLQRRVDPALQFVNLAHRPCVPRIARSRASGPWGHFLRANRERIHLGRS